MNSFSDVPLVPADSVAKWVKGFMVATLIVTGLGVFSGLLQVQLLSKAATVGITVGEAMANDARERLVNILQALVWVGTAVVFMIWFHRVRSNLSPSEAVSSNTLPAGRWAASSSHF